jgi:hypothetical protein
LRLSRQGARGLARDALHDGTRTLIVWNFSCCKDTVQSIGVGHVCGISFHEDQGSTVRALFSPIRAREYRGNKFETERGIR